MSKENPSNDFSYYLSNFLMKYLGGERNLSTNTILSYKDSFKLLLIYFKNEKNIVPNKIRLSDITRNNIILYLEWLKEKRKMSISSTNTRLAAIHSFINYVQIHDINYIHEFNKVLSIKNKRYSSSEVGYLSIEEIKCLLSMPDVTTKNGRKDKTLLTLLYDTGARVDEIINLKYEDIRLNEPATISLKGKGKKIRIVPLMGNTAGLLGAYIEENDIGILQYSTYNNLFISNIKRNLLEPVFHI